MPGNGFETIYAPLPKSGDMRGPYNGKRVFGFRYSFAAPSAARQRGVLTGGQALPSRFHNLQS